METTVRFDKLLVSCRDMTLSHLRPLLDGMFENADVALLSFAEKAESNMTQSLFFDAMNEVRTKRPVVEQVFFRQLEHSFSNFPISAPEGTDNPTTTTGAGGLSLVDTAIMEESVAIRNAVHKLNRNILECMFALKQRLSILNNGNAVTENQIPGGPAWLGAAFQKAVDELELETRVRLVVIALFDKYVLEKLHGLFDEYNERLIQASILPNLKYEVLKNPAANVATLNPAETSIPAPEPDPEARQDGEDGSTVNSDDLFGRICGLLSVPHGVTSQAPTGVAPRTAAAGNITPLHSDTNRAAAHNIPAGSAHGDSGTADRGRSVLVSSINSVQSQVHNSTAATSSTDFIANIEIDEKLIGHLQETLSREREKIFGALDRRKIPTVDNNVIELVGMLFEFMLKEENLPNIAKALLSRLHTPLLKAAVIDRKFFTDSNQAARKLLNDMIAAGKRWVDEQQLERGIFPAMKETVDRVLEDFHENTGVFVDILTDFDAHVDELKRRATVVEKRTNEAASGQEKLLAARQQAQQQIQDIVAGQKVDTSVEQFLSKIWSDRLTFIVLRNRQGTASEEWRDAVELARQMVESTRPPTDEEVRRTRQASLNDFQQTIREASYNLQQADKEKLLSTLFNRQQAALQSLANDEPPSPQASPTEFVESAESTPQSPSTPEDQTADYPEITAMIAKLRAVDFGTWFEFSQADTPAHRAKLSWHSTVTEKFMFVDQLGVKVAIIPSRELAVCMLSGNARILETEHKPFVNRALEAIHRVLEQRSKATANA